MIPISKKLLEFIPMSNAWFKSAPTIAFKIQGIFAFVERNIFQIIFKSATKASQLFLFKSKNKFEFKLNKLKAQYYVFCKSLNKNHILFNAKARASSNLLTQSENGIMLNVESNPTVKVIVKPVKSKFAIQSNLTDKFKILYSSLKNRISVSSNSTADIKLIAEAKENKIAINNKIILFVIMFCKSISTSKMVSKVKSVIKYSLIHCRQKLKYNPKPVLMFIDQLSYLLFIPIKSMNGMMKT